MHSYKEVEEKMMEVANNVNIIKLHPDHSCYYNTVTGVKYNRVTNYITDKEVKMTPLLKSSVIIGTKVDNLVRDYFDGNVKDYSSYNIASDKNIDYFLKQVEQLKKLFDSRGEKVIPNDVILYNDELGIAGTVDLISYDIHGVIRIYDMKTMRGNQFTTKWYGDCQYKYVSTMYGMSNKEKHQRQISMYNILLNNTHGLKAGAAGIIPIEVDYKPKDIRTKKLKMLPRYRHQLLDKVNDAVLMGE